MGSAETSGRARRIPGIGKNLEVIRKLGRAVKVLFRSSSVKMWGALPARVQLQAARNCGVGQFEL
jgi:hypothetical protein